MEYVTITSTGSTSCGETHLKLSTGQSLGLVQAVSWELSIGHPAQCVITSIASPAEVKALARHSVVLVKPFPGSLKECLWWIWYCVKHSLSR